MSIGSRIKTLRKNKSITQEELATVMNVSRQSISKWESDNTTPDIEKVIFLSDFFQTTTDYILKGIIIENELKLDNNYKANEQVGSIRQSKAFIVLSVLATIVGSLGMLSIIVLSKIKTFNNLPYNHNTGKYRIGLDAFTYVYNLKELYGFMVFLFIFGLITTFVLVFKPNVSKNIVLKSRLIKFLQSR